MAKRKSGAAPRVNVTIARPKGKGAGPSRSSGGKWTRAAKFAGALFGVGVLAYAARVLFPQNSALGRFLVTGAAGVALAAAFGSFKGTRSFATTYVLPAAVAMATLDAGTTVAQDWGSAIAGKLRGMGAPSQQAALPSKPTAPSSMEQTGSFAAPTPPPPPPTVSQPKPPSTSATVISALIGAGAQIGSSLISAYAPKGSAGVIEDTQDVVGSGRVIDVQAMNDALFA